MATTVYSASLFEAQGLDAPASVIVPTGHVHVVRCIDVVFVEGDVSGSLAWLGGVGQTIWLASFLLGTESRYFAWRGHQVFVGGVNNYGFSPDIATDITVSGYDLVNP